MLALLFPGQGEQRPGMLHELPEQGRDVLAEAGAALGEDPLALDTAAALSGTRATQLSLLIAGTAWHRSLQAHGVSVQYLAGHSVGAWTAAVAAGAISFEDAVRLVDVRARTMLAATTAGDGMAVVEGPGIATVRSAADAVRAEGLPVWASNVNSRTQSTVSGTESGLLAVGERLRALGARVRRLDVSVAAHSPLMHPAAAAVRSALDDVQLSRPGLPLAGNVTGQTLFTPTRVAADLVDGIEHGVRWDLAMAILAERGVDSWAQIPPGRSLVGLVPSGRARALLDGSPRQR